MRSPIVFAMAATLTPALALATAITQSTSITSLPIFAFVVISSLATTALAKTYPALELRDCQMVSSIVLARVGCEEVVWEIFVRRHCGRGNLVEGLRKDIGRRHSNEAMI